MITFADNVVHNIGDVGSRLYRSPCHIRTNDDSSTYLWICLLFSVNMGVLKTLATA